MEIIEAYLTRNPCYQANVREEDSRYTAFQTEGPRGLMLHSVGCAQPKASVFLSGWDKPDYDRACVHAFIDGKTGTVYQTLPWSFRGWHCGGPANETHVGVELCESDAIRYLGANRFEIINQKTALADCARSYAAAVELFAFLCLRYDLDPMTAILSHKEGAAAGLASDHGDPEHYWSGLGMSYTMDGFRADVSALLQQGQQEPQPESAGFLGFPDVSEEDWYADALSWAVEHNVILQSGKPFNPDTPLTKATAIVHLRRLWNALPDSTKSE